MRTNKLECPKDYYNLEPGDLFCIEGPLGEYDGGKKKVFMKTIDDETGAKMVDLQDGAVWFVTESELKKFVCIKAEGNLNFWIR